jgi:hypothetical protein
VARHVTKVKFTTGLRAASQCIAWIGAAAGVFERHGLVLSFPRLEVGGPESAAGLLRGDWQFAQTGTVPVAEAVLNGGDTVIVLRNTVDHDNLLLVAHPHIASLGALDGRRVGVLTSAYSGQAGVIARRAIERTGASARYAGLGTYRNILCALRAGDIEAGVLPLDYRFTHDPQSGWTMFELESLRVPSVLATTRRLIASDRELVLNVLSGFVATIHLFKAHREVGLPLLQRFLEISDPAVAARIYDYYAPLFPDLPRPTLGDGIGDIHDLFAERYPAARGLREGDITDSSLLDEIEQNAFPEQLYSKPRLG